MRKTNTKQHTSPTQLPNTAAHVRLFKRTSSALHLLRVQPSSPGACCDAADPPSLAEPLRLGKGVFVDIVCII